MTELYKHLKGKLKVCKLNSAGTEINIRCPYCGDSIKDPYKGHLYISTKPPYFYYCQRCNSTGRVNKEFLSKLECDNNFVLLNAIQREYHEYSKKVDIKYGKNLNFLKTDKPIIFPRAITKKDIEKKRYIEDRLGITLTDTDIDKFKIVFSIKRFLSENKLDIIKKNIKNKFFIKNINTIEDNCVGFLSSDRSTIIFRSLDKSITGYRYNNFTLFPEIDSKKTYTISTELDLSSRIFEVYLAEGILDILGVYNHFYKDNLDGNKNKIFVANAGKSYMVTSNFLKKLGILNADIFIYSDSDVNLNFYKSLVKDDLFFGLNGISIFYNDLGKDFGVRKDEIKLSRRIEL